ncbi:hypothetical protein ACWCW7_33095 [Nocardia tengchongensis]
MALRLFRDMSVPWTPGSGVEAVSTDPGRLPYYAARTTLRMFLGLAASILFTLVASQWAAHSRRAEKVLVPMVDVLQSVPVLALVSITVTAFVAILVLDNNPGRIKSEIQVRLGAPRDPRSAVFQALVDQAYRLLADTGEHEHTRRAA